MKLKHICEVCGKTEELTSDEGFENGWDYPPVMGAFGVVSPRTCGNCPITGTLYWRIITVPRGETYSPTEEELELIQRIQTEPESIQVKEEHEDMEGNQRH